MILSSIAGRCHFICLLSSTLFCRVWSKIHKCELWTSGVVGKHHRYTWEVPNLRHLDFSMGSYWGSSDFSCNQNNRGSSGAYVTCIYCGLSVKINMRKTLHGAQRSCTHLYLFLCMWTAKTQRPPQFEPHGWRRRYTGRYRRSVISRVYLWETLKLYTLNLYWCKAVAHETIYWGPLKNQNRMGLVSNCWT